MNAEVTKANGQKKVATKKAPAKPIEKLAEKPKVEKPKAPAKDTVWMLAKTMMKQGAKDEEIKKAAYDYLLKTLDPKKALEQWSARLAYRAWFRARKAAKKGEKKNAAA